MRSMTFAILALLLLLGCSPRQKEKSDASTSEIANDTVNDLRAGKAQLDALELGTRPRTVLVTGVPQYRLTPILKKNWDANHRSTFFGDIDYRENYAEDEIGVNVWHSHLVPGYEAACGYNIVNVSHFDTQTRQQHNLFDSLVLIKTLYYPSYSIDTLHRQPVFRNDYLVSVFDEDTNRDGFINQNDLRHFYHFALPSLEKTALIPKNHSVVSSEYDPGNDWMYVFTREDQNKNGKIDAADAWHVFWVDMKAPRNFGQVM
jgi:hypothetical protein